MSEFGIKLSNGYRVVWGLFFLASAVFNAVITLPNAERVLQAFEELSVPGADALLRALLPYSAGLIAVVVVFEALVGVLILSKGSWARLGIGVSIAWIVVLIPFLSWYGVVNILLAITLVPVFKHHFDRSFYDMTLGRLRGGHPERVMAAIAFTATVLTGASAVFGGVALMTNDNLVPRDFLEKTFFSSWVIPGILLIALVAVPMLLAAVVIARPSGDSALATMAAGGFLAAWIVGQLIVLDYGMLLQPAMLLTGLALMGLGAVMYVRVPHSARRSLVGRRNPRGRLHQGAPG